MPRVAPVGLEPTPCRLRAGNATLTPESQRMFDSEQLVVPTAVIPSLVFSQGTNHSEQGPLSPSLDNMSVVRRSSFTTKRAVRVTRIERASSGWKPEALPLYDTRRVSVGIINARYTSH